MKKILSFILIFAMCTSFAACSKKEKEEEVKENNNNEISEKYDSIVKESEKDSPIDSDKSVIGKEFTINDFTFTSTDATIAFSLDKNSFVKLVSGGTFFNYIAPGGDVVSYDGVYETAKGLSVLSSAKEFVEKYNIKDKTSLYKKADGDLYFNPSKGNFSGRLTALYASEDSLNYTALTDKDVQKFLSVWDIKADGSYINPEEITKLFPSYESVAVLNVTADDSGAVSEVSVYRFDR